MSTAFSRLTLPQPFLDNLTQLGYESMTPIQQQALPLVLDGKDVRAQAQTGSGKTAAFGIGALLNLNPAFFGCQCIVLCPTRELASQVAEELRRLARAIANIKILTLCGGQPIGPQIGSLEHGAHIVVGTPGRISDHIRKGTLKLNGVHTVVLDEADRMLDMGFVNEIENILEQVPSKRQILLFSATYPEDIQSISDSFQTKPETVKIETDKTVVNIKQKFYQVEKNAHKEDALIQVLGHYANDSTVIFCNTKASCWDVQQVLADNGYQALVLSGEMDQKDRDRTIVRFSNQSALILIATDVAARGLDVDFVSLVVNYDITRDAEVHVHRIGRTGRAGKKGIAATLLINSEGYKLTAINEYMDTEFEAGEAKTLAKRFEPAKAPMVTIAIDGGKKHKLRPGDILGALTAEGGISGKQVGKIKVFPMQAYVAIERPAAKAALNILKEKNMKGRRFKARRL